MTQRDSRDTFTLEVDDEGIMHLTFLRIEKDAKQNTEQAQAVREDMLDVLAQKPDQTFDTVVDATSVKNISFLSKEAKSTYLHLMNLPQIRRVAFVATGAWLKGMTSLFTQLTGKWNTTKWFSTKTEALKWLTEE